MISEQQVSEVKHSLLTCLHLCKDSPYCDICVCVYVDRTATHVTHIVLRLCFIKLKLNSFPVFQLFLGECWLCPKEGKHVVVKGQIQLILN